MKNKTLVFICLLLSSSAYSFALPPGAVSKHIKIDQFGYLPNSKKFAVIVDPQNGYNAAESFSPGTGVNQYQVRRWFDDVVVYSGTLTVWKAGATHTQSGDRGWWFDFSTVTATGSYYIFDVARNEGSPRFEINNNVYDEVLRQASRMYFYQRVNFPKQSPYTDAKWADAAAFEGSNQDRAARSRYDKGNAATARDVHGGWFDAGDYNKYVTFAMGPLCNLMETYRMHPLYFPDNNNIPESGNGIADILDEVKWELDWLTRMQDATGTNGLLLKVGVDNYNGSSPPSADTNPRYYVPECTSSTLTGAAVFALAGTIYKSLGIASMTTYGDGLLTRAANAWNRAKITTSNFNVFETACDDQDIKSGDADQGADEQREMIVTAAAYLFEATNSNEYKNCFDTMYTRARPYAFWWWGPYFPAVQRALLRYTLLPGATTAVVNNIKNVKSGQNYIASIDDHNNQTDLYRAHMPDDQYHWNSHEVKANAGLDNLDFATFNINTGERQVYKDLGENYLHWFHGVNPMGKVMLSNMYAFGGDSCVNEFYHGWFGDGTIWDNLFTSPNGPPPGYVPGGPNKDFSIPAMNPPGGQPPQKSYREWNTGWNGTANENSWEITEAGIYTQAAYISLLARVIANGQAAVLPLHVLTLSANRSNNGAVINWEINGADASREFEIERSFDRTHFIAFHKIASSPGINNYSANDNLEEVKTRLVYYRIHETDEQGRSYYSSIVPLPVAPGKHKLSLYPNPASGSITLYGYLDKKEKLVISLFNTEGKMVRREFLQLPAGNYSRSIPIEELVNGLYTLQVSGTNSGERQEIKFIKKP
jgi:endoglucanase